MTNTETLFTYRLRQADETLQDIDNLSVGLGSNPTLRTMSELHLPWLNFSCKQFAGQVLYSYQILHEVPHGNYTPVKQGAGNYS